MLVRLIQYWELEPIKLTQYAEPVRLSQCFVHGIGSYHSLPFKVNVVVQVQFGNWCFNLA